MNKLRSSKSQVCLPRQDDKKTKRVKMVRTPSLQATQQMNYEQPSFGQSSRMATSNIPTARQTIVRKPPLQIRKPEPMFFQDSKFIMLKLIEKCQPTLQQYDRCLKSSEIITIKISQLKLQEREIQERCQMLREDMSSRQVEKACALIDLEECQRLCELHRQQYSEESQLVQKQTQMANRRAQLNRQQAEVQKQLTLSDESWKVFSNNSNFNKKNQQFEYRLKKFRLTLFELETQCSRVAQQSKLRTLRNVICQFTNNNQHKHPFEKQNGFEMWLCSNQLVQQFSDCLQTYQKEVQSSGVSQLLNKYRQAMLSFNKMFQQGKKHYLVRKTHLSEYSTLAQQSKKIGKQLKMLESEQKQLNEQLELVFAQQKQSQLLQLNLEQLSTTELNSTIRRIDKEQRKRIRNMMEVDKRVNLAKRILGRQKEAEIASLLAEMKQESIRLIGMAKELRILKSEQMNINKNIKEIHSKINSKVTQQRKKQQKMHVMMIKDLCQIVQSTRTQPKQSVKQSRKLQNIKQTVNEIAEMRESELLNGAVTNRQLLKSARFVQQNRGSQRSSFQSLSNRITLRRFA